MVASNMLIYLEIGTLLFKVYVLSKIILPKGITGKKSICALSCPNQLLEGWKKNDHENDSILN